MQTHPIESLESRRFLSAASLSSFDPDQALTLSGIVFSDKVTKNNKPDPGEGMPGCVVTFNRNADHVTFTALSASDGSFSMVVDPGTYTVNVDGPDVTSPFNNASFVVPAGQDFTFNPRVGTDASPPSQPPPPPPTKKTDLAITIQQPPPSSISASAPKVPVTVRITNDGPAYKGPLDVTLYLSKNKTIDNADLPLPKISLPKISLAADSHKDFSFDAAPLLKALPGNGAFYVLAKIKATGDSTPSNDTAVSSRSKLAASAGAPNLTLSFAAPVTPAKHKSLHLSLTLKNTGTALAKGTGTLTLSAKPTAGGHAIPLGTLPLAKIKVQPNNGTQSLTGLTVSAASLPAGSYKLVAKLSSSLSTPESKTNDNSATSAAFIIK